MILKRDGVYDYGVVGERTNYRTIHGEDVHVGDLVKVELGEMYTTSSIVEPMVKEKGLFGEDKAFVMGIEFTCNDERGTIEGARILEIVKPYTALEVGEELGTCDITVHAEEKEEPTNNTSEGEEMAKELFTNILDKAIADLKVAGKDYHGLELIRTLSVMGGLI